MPKILIVILTFFLTACGMFNIRIEPVQTAAPTDTAVLPGDTPLVIASPTEQIVPTATVVPASPTLPPPTATQAQQAPAVPTSTTSGEQTIQIFLIVLEDNGQSGVPVGCGDSALPIHVTVPRTQGILRAALEKLLSAKQQFYGEAGYYNALYQSDLEVGTVTIEQGKAIIHLTGSISLGGVCDAPRVEAQIEQTALQFSTVNEVEVFINGIPLEEVLSSR
jgi:hypothetical protein